MDRMLQGWESYCGQRMNQGVIKQPIVGWQNSVSWLSKGVAQWNESLS